MSHRFLSWPVIRNGGKQTAVVPTNLQLDTWQRLRHLPGHPTYLRYSASLAVRGGDRRGQMSPSWETAMSPSSRGPGVVRSAIARSPGRDPSLANPTPEKAIISRS